MIPSFHSEGIECHPLSPKDQDDYVQLFTDEKVMRKIAPPMTEASAIALFNKSIALNENTVKKRWTWSIIGPNNEFLGIQGLAWKDSSAPDWAEAGIMLNQHSGGKGIAVKAIGALVDTAFRYMETTHVFAYFAHSNIAVEKFVQKVGFELPSPPETPDANQHLNMKYCLINQTLRRNSKYCFETTLL